MSIEVVVLMLLLLAIVTLDVSALLWAQITDASIHSRSRPARPGYTEFARACEHVL